jgi:hypothetical protein
MLLSTAWAKQGFYYRVWSEAPPKDWLKIEAKLSECRHIDQATIEREQRDLGAKVFAREYDNQFDSLEQRFFDMGSVDNAFGAIEAPTPPVETANEDPVIHRAPAFGNIAA